MTTPASPVVEPSERDSGIPSLIRRSRENMPNAVWYGLIALAVAILFVFAQIIMYMQRREPRDARAIVERELRMNTLRPGERVTNTVAVFRRNGVDYFRATRGLLVLTDRRLIYLGAPPRDITGAADAPPTFDQRAFGIDTLVTIKRSFAVLGLSRALRIKSPDDALTLGIATGGKPQADSLRAAWAERHEQRYALGVWAGKVRDARAELVTILEAYRSQPVRHVVRPGDAISSIADWYEIPVETIREQNGIVGNTIKVGQELLIRPGRSN